MSGLVAANSEKPLSQAWEKLLVGGELQQLSSEQRAQYYLKVCSTLGLNHLTRPFDYIFLNGKLTFYIRKDGTDQLRQIHAVSVKITSREKLEDIYVVTAQAERTLNGITRNDESVGAVFIGGLKGAELANAIMKAETKAKRRVTLSICGLGFLDESEIEDAQPGATQTKTGAYAAPEYVPGLEPEMTVAGWVAEGKNAGNVKEHFTALREHIKATAGEEWVTKFDAEMHKQGVSLA